MLGNGVVGVLAETVNEWERRAPLTPSHCAKLLHGGKYGTGVARIVVQPSTKRIHHDALYEDVGCEISEDLSECGLIIGIKQPKLEMILPDRAYAFFSRTHKAQKENMLETSSKEIFKLLPHTFVHPSKLPELFAHTNGPSSPVKRVFQVYGCVVTCQHMVEHIDPLETFDKADYYAHPEHNKLILHEKIAPYASVIVNCIYWEKKFPRLLSNQDLHDLMKKGCPLVGIADITCDIEGSLELINQTTSIDAPIFRYDPVNGSYHQEMEGDGVICSSVDILPTEFAKEASQHFAEILSRFVGSLASVSDIGKLPAHLRGACIAHGGAKFEYIPRIRQSDSKDIAEAESLQHSHSNRKRINILVGADDRVVLDQIIGSLTCLAHLDEKHRISNQEPNKILLKFGEIQQNGTGKGYDMETKTSVLIVEMDVLEASGIKVMEKVD